MIYICGVGNWLTLERSLDMSLQTASYHFLDTVLFHFVLMLSDKLWQILSFSLKCFFVSSFILNFHINKCGRYLSWLYIRSCSPVCIGFIVGSSPNKTGIIQLCIEISFTLSLLRSYFVRSIFCFISWGEISWYLVWESAFQFFMV